VLRRVVAHLRLVANDGVERPVGYYSLVACCVRDNRRLVRRMILFYILLRGLGRNTELRLLLKTIWHRVLMLMRIRVDLGLRVVVQVGMSNATDHVLHRVMVRRRSTCPYADTASDVCVLYVVLVVLRVVRIISGGSIRKFGRELLHVFHLLGIPLVLL